MEVVGTLTSRMLLFRAVFLCSQLVEFVELSS